MFHIALTSLSVLNPHAGHSLVMPSGLISTECVPSQSRLYSSIALAQHIVDGELSCDSVLDWREVNRLGVKPRGIRSVGL